MPKQMTKNSVVIPLSLGKATVIRGGELLEKYQKWKKSLNPLKGCSSLRSELFDLALNLGFAILEPIADEGKWSELDSVRSVVSRMAKKKAKAKTIGDLTDEDISRLEDGEKL